MADWTTIADSNLEPNAPVRSVDHIALRDNPIAITEGAAGAPRNQWAALTTALQDYITAQGGLHASGAYSYPGPVWSNRAANSTNFVVPPGGAGVVFSNQANRSITFKIRVYFRANFGDDSFRVRVKGSTGTVLATNTISIAGGTNYETEFTFTISSSTTQRYFVDGALSSGGGADEVLFQGVSAFIPPFF